MKRTLLNSSVVKSEQVIKINPQKYSAWSNWGAALQRLADLEQNSDKKRILLQDSIEKFERSVALGCSSDRVRENLKQLREELAQLK